MTMPSSHPSPTPIVSIVTVCLNAAATIGDTFASVRAQRDPRVEYVVVDGVSTDGTGALIDANADLIDRLHVGRDRGLYDAMNTGARLARGRFLWFLNADDRLEDGALALVLDRLADPAAAEATILVGTTRRVDGEGRTVELEPFGGADRAALVRGNPFPHPSTVMSRALFERCGGFSLRWRIVSDYDLLWRAVLAGARVEPLDRVLAVMRQGGLSSTDAPLRIRVRHELETLAVQRLHGSTLDALAGHLVRWSGFLFGRPTRGPATGPAAGRTRS